MNGGGEASEHSFQLPCFLALVSRAAVHQLGAADHLYPRTAQFLRPARNHGHHSLFSCPYKPLGRLGASVELLTVHNKQEHRHQSAALPCFHNFHTHPTRKSWERRFFPQRRGFSRPRPLVFRWVSAPWKKLHSCNKAGLLEHNGRQTEPITVTTKAGGRSVHTGRGGGVWGWWQGGWGKRGRWGGQPVGRLTDSLHFLLCRICCQVAAEEEDETQRTNCLRRLN